MFAVALQAPDQAGISRADLQYAFQLAASVDGSSATAAASERFLDINDILKGCPDDLVFADEEGIVV